MSVAIRGLAAACAAALTLGIVTQPTGSAAQAPGHERARTAGVADRAHGRVAILQRPQRRFERSIRLGHLRVQRIQAAHRDSAHGQAAAPQGDGGFPSPESVGVSSATLETIAACESGGDPTAVSVDGTYHGLYQFDYGTWASVGGSGDPAAASPEEQTYRAALLYERSGPSAWPICGS
jgi:transglycosylase-like protein